MAAHLRLLVLSLFFFSSLGFADANLLEGDFHGRIKVGTNPVQNGVLHIRRVQTEPKKYSLIAVLAASSSDDGFHSGMPFHFTDFIAGDSDRDGYFSLLIPSPRNGIGTQFVALQLNLDPSGNAIHGQLTSNLIGPDGTLIEMAFDFSRGPKLIPLI